MPMQKSANESWPLKFEIIGVNSGDPLIQRDELRMSLGSVMSARYRRQKVLGNQAEWQVLSGGIGIGQPAPQPDNGLALYANAKTMNIDEWTAFRSAMTKDPDGSKAGGNEQAASDSGMSAYLEPDVVALRATEMKAMGKKTRQRGDRRIASEQDLAGQHRVRSGHWLCLLERVEQRPRHGPRHRASGYAEHSEGCGRRCQRSIGKQQ